ncbi:MAG TPA: universal stress protein, partial [Flavisolibacter sp.]|nr:universal stress protein [Flavisolibacter sp.]
MKTIVVPTDFTPASANAGEYAASLAEAFSADVELLHAFHLPVPIGNVPEPQLASASLRNARQSRVNKEVSRLKTHHTVPVSGSAITGFTSDSLSSVAEDDEADLVVMGLKEHHKNRLTESTTLKMLRKSARPLLVVPERTPFKPLKHLVLAVDFSQPVREDCFALLFAIARKFDASVRVLHVVKNGADIDPSDLPQKLQLEKALSPLTYFYNQVEYDDINKGILSFINSHPTDLLVMIAHRHSFFERLLGQSHTRAICS